jgi:hypothetical protein
LTDAPYVSIAPDAPPVKTETWTAPVAQSRGRDWIYDTFTPRRYFYNARSKQFTVKPPSSLVDEDTQESFGLDLVAVRPEPFRLQLIGYVGGEGNWRGHVSESRHQPGLPRVGGYRVPNLGLTVRSLDVSAQPIKMGESMTTASAWRLRWCAMKKPRVTSRSPTASGFLPARCSRSSRCGRDRDTRKCARVTCSRSAKPPTDREDRDLAAFRRSREGILHTFTA